MLSRKAGRLELELTWYTEFPLHQSFSASLEGTLGCEGAPYEIDQRWIDLLSQSIMALFSDSIAQAGVFLQFPSAEDYQPDPFWYCEFGVPMWYPWNYQQIKDPKYKHLAPLPHQLQEAPEDQCASPLSSSSFSNTKSHHISSTKQMDEFFKIKEERNVRKLATATEQE